MVNENSWSYPGDAGIDLSMQLCMQKVLAMAVRTVMMKLMMVLMFSFSLL